ncbi:MAG: universal stress protein [Aliishimia sp.]
MYNNILVPISFDADRDSAGAISVAQQMLNDGGTIRLLHVTEVLPAYAVHQVPQEYIAEAQVNVSNRLEELSSPIAGCVTEIANGHAGRAIADVAAKHDSDLVIVASHRPGMQNLLLGSTATHAVRHVHCAVHVLR